jgi:Icc-related predicted phosphoesterase
LVNTRLYFTTDIHGSELCFLKFVSAGKFYKADVIVFGGDITGKMIVPLVEMPDGTRTANFQGLDNILKNDEEALKLEKMIRDSGYYPYRTTQKEMEELNADPAKVDALFSRLMNETLGRWLGIIGEKLKGTGIKVYIVPGNDDRHEIDAILEKSEFAVNPEGKVTEIDPHHEMIASGYANMTPWKCPRDIEESDLEKRIEDMASHVKNTENAIFALHCPPVNTELDIAPKLDATLRPVVERGGLKMDHVGSTAVRKTIEKYQPLLGLHGHIHESKGSAKIGRTLCLNAGSEYSEGVLRGIIVDLHEKGFNDYVFTSG